MAASSTAASLQTSTLTPNLSSLMLARWTTTPARRTSGLPHPLWMFASQAVARSPPLCTALASASRFQMVPKLMMKSATTGPPPCPGPRSLRRSAMAHQSVSPTRRPLQHRTVSSAAPTVVKVLRPSVATYGVRRPSQATGLVMASATTGGRTSLACQPNIALPPICVPTGKHNQLLAALGTAASVVVPIPALSRAGT